MLALLDDARRALRPGACLAAILLTALVPFAPGCAREHRAASQPLALSVEPAADTGTMPRLEIRPPRPARATLVAGHESRVGSGAGWQPVCRQG